MRKLRAFLLLSMVLVSGAFAAAAIGNHGRFLSTLTGGTTTGTTMTSTNPRGTSTTPLGRRVTLCHRRHSWKHGWVQITVGQAAVFAHLRHGDHLGPCVMVQATAPVTTTTTTKSDDSQGDDDSGHGNSGKSGHGESDHGNSGHGDSGHGNSGHGHDDD